MLQILAKNERHKALGIDKKNALINAFFFSFIIMRPPRRSSERLRRRPSLEAKRGFCSSLVFSATYIRRKKKDYVRVCHNEAHGGRLLYHFSLSAFVAFVKLDVHTPKVLLRKKGQLLRPSQLNPCAFAIFNQVSAEEKKIMFQEKKTQLPYCIIRDLKHEFYSQRYLR